MQVSTKEGFVNDLIQKRQWVLLTPTFCIALFIALYIYSTSLYPGGSYSNPSQLGYSWVHNYLCNLVGPNALNGQINEAKNISIIAIFILGFGIGYFYLIFPRYFEMRKLWRRVIQSAGVASMFFAVFLFTDQHDLVLNIAGILGVITIFGSLVALSRHNAYGLMWTGLACCFLIAANAYIYYTKLFIDWLPLIQKITITILLLWIVLMNLSFYQSEKRMN